IVNLVDDTLLLIDGAASSIFADFLVDPPPPAISYALSLHDALPICDLTIVGRGQISSSTASAGNAGSVSVVAGTLRIDGSGFLDTGIFADAVPGSSGKGGTAAVQARNLTILGGGEIASSTFGEGKGG